MSRLFRDLCKCYRGILPGGDLCPQFPRCWVEKIIGLHSGRERAISITQLAQLTGLSAREIKQAVHELRMEGIRIGSARHAAGAGAAGYFMIETLAELREFLRGYGRQALSELRLIQALLGKDYSMVKELEGQLTLDVGEIE